jgi:hypothetical protein
MPDEKAVSMPAWLAALHCPICGDVKLSRAWKAPDHIPDVLEGFGSQHPPARRWIVIKLNAMAENYRWARSHKPLFGPQEAKAHFSSTVSAAKNLLNKLPDLEVRHAILMAMHKLQREHRGPNWLLNMDLSVATPLDNIDLALEFIRIGSEEILRDPDLYYAPLGQPPVRDSRKSLERTLLWEPLLDLMHDFGIEEFDQYQDLTKTVGALHLALGIGPPKKNLLKQVAFLWRKRRLNSAA